MKSSLSRARALLYTSLATGVALLFAACGQEPGRTGLDYLESEGVLIAAPLYHLSFDDLPVDSVYGTEVPLNHYGESLLVVGREGHYVAKARMGFQFSTQAQRDSLSNGLYLRLTALPLSTNDDTTSSQYLRVGRRYLRESSEGHDTLRVLVESYSFPDSGSFGDSLIRHHRRILNNPVPFSTLEAGRRTRDTITIYPRRAYPATGVVQDTTQVGALPHLRARLLNTTDSARRWAVYVELSPLTASDSGLFRFIGQAASNSETNIRQYNSGLWSGRYAPDSLAVGLLVKPFFSTIGTSAAKPATNYEYRYDGPATRTVLHGVARGVHLRINRDTLINRIRLKLNALDPARPTLGDDYLGANPTGNFDRRFYVPYAQMRLPVDQALTRVPGAFALDMGVTSDVDSLGLDTAAFRDDIVLAAGSDSLVLPVYGGSGSVKMDNLVIKYRAHPADAGLRQVMTHWAGDPAVADTFVTEPDGRHRELTLTRRTGWQRSATLSIVPAAANLRLEVFFNVGSILEPRDILDSTGKAITAPRDLASRFYRPGADSVKVRVTRGLRTLLNRNYAAGTSVAPDMFLRTIDRAVYDTAAINGSTYQRVIYPYTGEIEFKRAPSGRLEVGLDLYLYPLEAGQ